MEYKDISNLTNSEIADYYYEIISNTTCYNNALAVKFINPILDKAIKDAELAKLINNINNKWIKHDESR